MSDLAIRERVAREVMGMAQVSRGTMRVTESNADFYVDRPVAQTDGPLLVAADTDGSGWLTVPAYETDIAAAWLVVEEMRKRGYRLQLVDNDLPTGANWDARFYKFPESVEIAYYAAPTAPPHTERPQPWTPPKPYAA